MTAKKSTTRNTHGYVVMHHYDPQNRSKIKAVSGPFLSLAAAEDYKKIYEAQGQLCSIVAT